MSFEQVTMSQDDPNNCSSVYCWSTLTTFDWNQSSKQSGSYLLANLVEIHLKFQHYRCETYTNFINNSCKQVKSSLSPQQQQPVPQISLYDTSGNTISSDSQLKSVPVTPKPVSAEVTAVTTKRKPSDLGRKLNCLKKLYANTTRLNCFGKKKADNGNGFVSYKALPSPKGASCNESQLKHKSINKSEIVHCHQFGGLHATDVASEKLTPHDEDEDVSGNETNPVKPKSLIISSQTTPELFLVYSRNTHQKLSASLLAFHSQTTCPDSTLESENTTLSEADILKCCGNNSKLSQLDYRSVSEYSFNNPTINTNQCIKADVYSLPTCIDEMNSTMLQNNNSVHSSSTQKRGPSYVGISRVNAGYANYNRYCSEYKRDNSLLKYEKYSYEMPEEDSNESKKRFLHKKVESLYGETFADQWERKLPPRPTQSDRSPSCPPGEPGKLESVNGMFKSLPKLKPLDPADNGNSNLVQNKPNLIRSNYQDQYDINNDVDNTQNAQWFLKQISTKSKDITDHIENYEKLINDCSADIPEEIVGKIRASIGKANLLLSKKFKQFHQLCQDSIRQTETEEFQIKCDDLRGFWDMVLIQVDAINNTFEELDRLKANNWQPIEEVDSQQKVCTPSRRLVSRHNCDNRTQSVSPRNSPRKSSSNSEREAERRNRLLQAKLKGKQRALEQNTDEEITIFTPK